MGKKNAANLLATLTSFIVIFSISFFLTPYIVRTLGVEANGYLRLVDNLVSYTEVLTIVITSMAARFVTVEIRRGSQARAQGYYTSSYMGTLLSAAILLPLMIVLVWRFGEWFDVAPELVFDVTLFLIFVCATVLMRLVLPQWGVGFWATNSLYIDSTLNIFYAVIRGGLIVVLFVFFPPQLYYVGAATFVGALFKTFASGRAFGRLLPKVSIDLARFEWRQLREIIVSGVWNSVTRTNVLLLSGVDIVLAAVLVGPTGMGLLALAKTIPLVITQLGINLQKISLPSITYAFADGDYRRMGYRADEAGRIVSIFTSAGFAVLVIFGEEFFRLWVPSEDARLLYLLAVVSSIAAIITITVDVLINIFVATNTLRRHSLAVLAIAVLNVPLAILLVNFTNWGIFGIVWAGVATQIVRALFVTIPFAGKVTAGSIRRFYPSLAWLGVFLATFLAVGLVVSLLLPPSSWMGLMIAAGVMVACGSLVNLLPMALTPEGRRIAAKIKGCAQERR